MLKDKNKSGVASAPLFVFILLTCPNGEGKLKIFAFTAKIKPCKLSVSARDVAGFGSAGGVPLATHFTGEV
ncbi:MAG: hypothetical protein FWC36_00235 [Spirochaetes bacterium]|nr:hypothetical protein [Spirochaetota bacterium]